VCSSDLNLYSGPASQFLGIIFAPADAPDAPLPAGNYICRLTSSAYSEDEIFFMDPVTPAAMTVVVADGDGNMVTGFDDSTLESAQVYGPLQEAWLNFDRALSAPELEYLLEGGLRITGTMEMSGPDQMVVAPDSTSIHITSFTPSVPWREVLGGGAFTNWGFLAPGTGRYRVGYHHSGITKMAANCASIGPPDPDDWQTEQLFSMAPACPNPVAPGLFSEIRIGFSEDAYTVVRVYDEEGNVVRTLVEDWLNSGVHAYIWDLADNEGVPVPDGTYHVTWAASNQNPEIGRAHV